MWWTPYRVRPTLIFAWPSTMPRTKQTAEKSTGDLAPRKKMGSIKQKSSSFKLPVPGGEVSLSSAPIAAHWQPPSLDDSSQNQNVRTNWIRYSAAHFFYSFAPSAEMVASCMGVISVPGAYALCALRFLPIPPPMLCSNACTASLTHLLAIAQLLSLTQYVSWLYLNFGILFKPPIYRAYPPLRFPLRLEQYLLSANSCHSAAVNPS